LTRRSAGRRVREILLRGENGHRRSGDEAGERERVGGKTPHWDNLFGTAFGGPTEGTAERQRWPRGGSDARFASSLPGRGARAGVVSCVAGAKSRGILNGKTGGTEKQTGTATALLLEQPRSATHWRIEVVQQEKQLPFAVPSNQLLFSIPAAASPAYKRSPRGLAREKKRSRLKKPD